MAKALGAKSLLIRDAPQAHPDKSPKEIADLINDSDAMKQDKIEVKPIDVSQQKLALKKAAQAGRASAVRAAGRRSTWMTWTASAALATSSPRSSAGAAGPARGDPGPSPVPTG